MADQEAKNPKNDDQVIKAINEIASTKAGMIFFRWLAHRCFHTRSTIVGDPTSHEINPLGSIAQAYVQRLFQDIYRVIKPETRIKIDYPHTNDE
ncbi:MAG: hypothetical protein GX638_18820 [Crenarchaeota archaeon]|nr:hypothetical protein [Thermoproteota archaeon]